MPRMPRYLCDQGVFHVLTRGNNGQPIFHDHQDFQHYLNLLQLCKRKLPFYLYHYCLMPNHVHLIIEVTCGERLSAIMHLLNLRYAMYYHKRYGTRGHFWQDRFKSLLISRDEYLLECGRYIEFNPVRAGLVNDPLEYPWTSYPVYAIGAHQALVDLDPVYLGLGNDASQRQAAYQAYVWQREETIRLAISKGSYLGNPTFVTLMKKRFGKSSPSRPRGRPAKTRERFDLSKS